MKQYLDSVWFNKFRSIGHISYVDLLVLDSLERARQRDLFLKNEIENPRFTYPLLRDFNFEHKKYQLRELANEITREESNRWVKEAYVRLLEEKLQHVALLEATNKGDDEVFSKISVQEFGDFLPDTIAKVPPLAEVLKRKTELADVGANEIEARFRDAFIEYDVIGWQIVRDAENLNSFVHINQETQTVHIPESRLISRAHLEALVRHEIGVHIRRRQNAEKTNFKLLTLGLDHYIKGDEGLGKYEELKAWPQAFGPSIQNYVGVAMVRGVDGKQRTFRELFDFFVQYLTEAEAWTRVEKIFRGTTGQSRGFCFTKDVMYLDGYYGILDTIEKRPQEQARFLVGKYDPANEWHRAVLDGLGINS